MEIYIHRQTNESITRAFDKAYAVMGLANRREIYSFSFANTPEEVIILKMRCPNERMYRNLPRPRRQPLG
jgi:hypothetical protein